MYKVDQFRFFENINEFQEYMNNLKITRKITKIQHHHTFKPDYSDFNGNNHAKIMKSIDNYHENNNGWSDSGHHFMVFPDGTIASARDLNKNPAGIYGQNSGSICIENFGNFDKDIMTQKQKDSIIAMTAILCTKFAIKPNINTIVYHHWFDQNTGHRTNGTGNVKSCPGNKFFGGNKVEDAEQYFIPLVKNYINKGDKVVEEWKVQILKELHKLGLVKDYDAWLPKLDKEATVWMVFALVLNLYKKLKEVDKK